MSKEKQCECCHEWWYDSDVKENLCPNCYDYFKQIKQELEEFDLYITLFGNQGYRIATYYTKTEKIMLTCPNWYLPPDYIIKEFIEICKEQVQNENKD